MAESYNKPTIILNNATGNGTGATFHLEDRPSYTFQLIVTGAVTAVNADIFASTLDDGANFSAMDQLTIAAPWKTPIHAFKRVYVVVSGFTGTCTVSVVALEEGRTSIRDK